jgi:hypothetical protein
LSIERAYLYTVEVQDFPHLFAVVQVVPLLGVMVRVEHGNDNVMHVAGLSAGKIGGVQEVKRDGLAVRRCGSRHPGLVPGAAVMGHEQALAVEVEHGDHVFLALNLTHQRRTHGSGAKIDLHRLAAGRFPSPRTGKDLELFKRLLRIGRGKGHCSGQG